MCAFRVVIPSRYAASRLPGKPLLPVAGRPLVLRVWDLCQKAGAEEVLIATDDVRIGDCAQAAGADWVMTRADHASGTDRLAEVAKKRAWAEDDIVVNVQGDEPCLPPELVARVAQSLQDTPRAGIATLATPIADREELFRESAVKVVCDAQSLARTFGRAPLPWVRGEFGEAGKKKGPLPKGVPFLRHIGLYAYRVRELLRLARAPACAWEKAESLEQLRALYLGIEIHVGIVDTAPPPGVDTEEDLTRASKAFA